MISFALSHHGLFLADVSRVKSWLRRLPRTIVSAILGISLMACTGSDQTPRDAGADGSATAEAGNGTDACMSASTGTAPAAGSIFACPPDRSFCAPTFSMQVSQNTARGSCVGMNPRIVAGVCGSHQVWRRTEGPIAYVLTECIYDDAGAIELSFRCDDKTCRYGGRVVELDDCPDLGPDRCAPDAGAASDASADTPVRGAIEPCLTG